MNIVSNIIQNSVSGFVDAGMRSAGEYAGDLLIKAGDSIENAGIAYGNTVAGKFDHWGDAIKAQGTGVKPTLPKNNLITGGPQVKSRPKALPRSNSTPAPTKKITTSSVVSKPTAPQKPGIAKASTEKPTSKRATPAKSAPANSTKALPKPFPAAPAKPNSSNIKYTPGVLTGMPKSKTGPNKPANGSGKKPSGGEMKYTPGKLTGMPAKGASKSTPQLNFPPPSKPASKPNEPEKKGDDKNKKNKDKHELPKVDRTFF